MTDNLGEAAGVVLLDTKLNGVGGLGFLQEIREQYPGLPVLFGDRLPSGGAHYDRGGLGDRHLPLSLSACGD